MQRDLGSVRIPLTHVELKQVTGPRLHKGVDYVRAVHLYFLKLSLHPSLESSWPPWEQF